MAVAALQLRLILCPGSRGLRSFSSAVRPAAGPRECECAAAGWGAGRAPSGVRGRADEGLRAQGATGQAHPAADACSSPSPAPSPAGPARGFFLPLLLSSHGKPRFPLPR
ncbi:hypothetical protein ACRRTK_006200 [Alexandromys fortis]